MTRRISLPLCLLLLPCVLTAVAVAGLFVTARSFPVGRLPTMVAVGDFNGDGKADLVTGSLLLSQLLLGNGNGTFQPPLGQPPLSLETGYWVIAVGDFNADGKLDLAGSISGSNVVRVLLGNGDGTFRPGGSFASQGVPSSIVVGDFNADGKLDLAAANGGGGAWVPSVSVALGNGDGNFQAAQNFAVGGSPSSVMTTDFNGDGKLDLATVNPSFSSGNDATVSVLLGNGDGTFQAAVNTAPGTFHGSGVVGDFNGDGKPDLAVPGGAGVIVLLGNGNGTLQALTSLNVPFGLDGLAVGDFNADTRLDLAVTGRGNVVAVFPGKGDGTFRAASFFVVAASPIGLAVGDFNNNGKLDLVTVNKQGNFKASVTVLMGRGNGTFTAARAFSEPLAPSSVATTDFNGDGKPDLAVSGGVLLGKGFGLFRPLRPYAGGVKGLIDLRLGDFNQDGKLDVVGINPFDNKISLLQGLGDGNFQAAVDFAAGGAPTSLVVGDVDGNGKLDVVTGNRSLETVSVNLGNGDGSFQAAKNSAVGGPPNSIALGDINHDGKLDLVVAYGPSASYLLGNGDGTFQAPTRFDLDKPPLFAVAVGDLNGDGMPDFVIAGTRLLWVWLGNGTLTGVGAYAINGSSAASSVLLGDFNGDGKLDVAVNKLSDASVSVLKGNGDGTLQRNVTLDVPSGFSSATADFNGDGHADLAVVGGIGFTIFLNTGKP